MSRRNRRSRMSRRRSNSIRDRGSRSTTGGAGSEAGAEDK